MLSTRIRDLRQLQNHKRILFISEYRMQSILYLFFISFCCVSSDSCISFVLRVALARFSTRPFPVCFSKKFMICLLNYLCALCALALKICILMEMCEMKR